MLRPFEYRNPRLHTHFALDFHVEGEVLHGMCTDVSTGGVRATFGERKMALGSTGSLVLRHPLRQFTLQATVAHLAEDHVGLVFEAENSAERAASQQFTSMVGTSEEGR